MYNRMLLKERCFEVPEYRTITRSGYSIWKVTTTNTSAHRKKRELYHCCVTALAKYMKQLRLSVWCQFSSVKRFSFLPVGQVKYRPLSDFLAPNLSVCWSFVAVNVQFFVGIRLRRLPYVLIHTYSYMKLYCNQTSPPSDLRKLTKKLRPDSRCLGLPLPRLFHGFSSSCLCEDVGSFEYFVTAINGIDIVGEITKRFSSEN
jgi:hypothetical protein